MVKVVVTQDVGVAVSSEVWAQAVTPGSPAHEQARQLQATRFAQASAAAPDAGEAYLDAFDFAPSLTVPIVVFRPDPRLAAYFAPGAYPVTAATPVLGAARLELRGATAVESILRFPADSPGDRMLHTDRFGEIGGLAVVPGLSVPTVLDVLDAIGSMLLAAATLSDIEELWSLPRRPVMSLLLADIPDVLPAYHFALRAERIDWVEGCPHLERIRALHTKGLFVRPDDPPMIYTITREQLADDLDARLELRDARLGMEHALPQLMRNAQREAHRQVVREHTRMRDLRGQRADAPPAESTSAAADGATGPAAARQGFLPFAAPAGMKEQYLRAVLDQGAASARAYKQMSFELLDVRPGMRVFDVGCGRGQDLFPLADLAGPTGSVLGLDNDQDLLAVARDAILADGRTSIQVFDGDIERLALPNALFDRVRTDRVLQHVAHPERALDEIWRVLVPGGVVTLIEPDWRTIAVYPGSPAGGDDDRTLSRVLGRYQRFLTHALIGRRLHGLLAGSVTRPWHDVRVQVVTFPLLSWPVVDAVLELKRSALTLAEEEPQHAAEIADWLAAIAAASQRGEFYATLPLFYARGQRPDQESAARGATVA